ncbi:MAG: methylamine dehydrogenase, partial [Gammaproteobacteria bacterium]|nr:methylamine dehydrogenase [Gammaproteobacteria bacterium]
EKREFVAEHGIAGCSLAISTGDSGVTSLCSDGAFLTTTLSDDGASAASVRSAAVFADQSDPMFEKAGITGGVAYFPTFKGDVLPVDLSGDAAVPGERWPLASAEEKAAGWRPGGWQLVAADHLGRLYVLMNPNGTDGSHKDGGGEVWVFDAAEKQRIMRIPLPNWGVSVGVSNAEQPLLVVTNGELQLETYSTATGEMDKTLVVSMQTPFIVRGVR